MVRLTRGQVREVDRIAIERYRVPGVVLMENAARGAADVARQMVGPRDGVLVLCGGGNNGGDGLAVARHLHNVGIEVSLSLVADPTRYRGDALINYRICQAMKLSTTPFSPDDVIDFKGALIVDAIFGTGLTQPPREPLDRIAGALAASRLHQKTEILALDLPSGLDCDSGTPLGTTVRATRTVTFVAEKAGFANPDSRQYTGDVIVADIGCPREIIAEVLGRPTPLLEN